DAGIERPVVMRQLDAGWRHGIDLCHGRREPRNISRHARRSLHPRRPPPRGCPHGTRCRRVPLSRRAADVPRLGRARRRHGGRARGFWARGVRPGASLALLPPSTPLYLVTCLAAARLGAVTTGVNVRYRRTEIGQVLARAGARLLVGVVRWHDADFRAIVASLDGAP